jgi:hypothetical protein
MNLKRINHRNANLITTKIWTYEQQQMKNNDWEHS